VYTYFEYDEIYVYIRCKHKHHVQVYNMVLYLYIHDIVRNVYIFKIVYIYFEYDI